MKNYIRSKTFELSSEKENVRLVIKCSLDEIPQGGGRGSLDRDVKYIEFLIIDYCCFLK